jgi:hypothetical protein
LDIIEGEMAVNPRHIDMIDSSGRFLVQIPDTVDLQTRHRLVAGLQASGKAVEDFLGLSFRRQVNIRIFSARDFQRVSKLPGWAAGSYDGKIRIRVEDLHESTSSLENLLTHELVHALLGMHIEQAVPAWFHEGLAQLAEPHHIGLRRDSEMELRRLIALLRNYGSNLCDKPTFKDIKDHGEADAAYLLSRHFVAHLRELGGMKGIHDVLKQLRDGTPFEPATRKVFRQPMESIEQQWRSTLLERKLLRPIRPVMSEP